MKLMTIKQWRDERFVKGSQPTLATIRKWIDEETIPGQVFGGKYYVEVPPQEPVNDLVSKVLVS